MTLGLEEEVFEYLVGRYPELLPTEDELDDLCMRSDFYKSDKFSSTYEQLIALDYFKFGYRMAQKAMKE